MEKKKSIKPPMWVTSPDYFLWKESVSDGFIIQIIFVVVVFVVVVFLLGIFEGCVRYIVSSVKLC